tara:strand:- start:110 stop:1000 length:891 start_codon:yes stop_codon:yes gene_type:complete
MDNIRLLHVGLGKCGSGYLEQIFKEITKKRNIELLDIYKFIDKKKIQSHYLENENNLENKFPKNYILSKRSLFSKRWEFNHLEISFEHLKRNFSNDTTILLVLRNPYDLLNSIYIQAIQVYEIKKPSEFFYVEKNDIQRKNGMFNLYNFDYKFLISLYKSYFKNVIVVKYEDLNNLDFLYKIFDYDESFLESLQKYKDIHYNRSISSVGVSTIMFLAKFFDLKKYQRFIKRKITNTKNPIYKIKNRILRQFLLREFFQEKFDKIFPYKKFYIYKKFIPIDIDKINKEYNDLDVTKL